MWKCSKAMGNFLLHQHVNSEETNCVSLFPLHCSVALLCLFNWKQTPESFTLIVRLVYFICKKQHQVPSKLWIMFFDISLLLARLCAKYLKHKAAFPPQNPQILAQRVSRVIQCVLPHFCLWYTSVCTTFEHLLSTFMFNWLVVTMLNHQN